MSFNSSNLVSIQDIDIVIDPVSTMFELNNNYNEVKGGSLNMSIYRPRSSLLLSSEYNKDYHIYIQWESNKIVENEPVVKFTNGIGSINLEYAT